MIDFMVKGDLAAITGFVQDLQDQVELKAVPVLLSTLGTKALSLTKLNYIDKSRGSGGADGRPWKRLQAGTILARMRKRGHLSGGRNGGTINKATDANKQLLKRLEGAGAIAIVKKGGNTYEKPKRSKRKKGDIKTGDRVIVIDKSVRVGGETTAKTKGVKADAKKAIASGGFQIGVDTGAQLNSATPGYKGSDSKGGNIYDIRPTESIIIVGFGRSYSIYYDKDRPLIPSPVPDTWAQSFTEIGEAWLVEVALYCERQNSNKAG